MSFRSKSSLFPSFGLSRKGQDDFLLFNEKDYFSSPKPAATEISDEKKPSRKSKKQLILRRNLQAENRASPTVQTVYSPAFDMIEEVCSPSYDEVDVDKENAPTTLPSGQKKPKNKKSVRNTFSSWKQKLRKSTLRRNRLTDSPDHSSPCVKPMATPTSHVKLYSPFCIDTPSQPTTRNKIEHHHVKPRRFQFSSPGKTKKSVSDGIHSLASLADGLDAAIADNE